MTPEEICEIGIRLAFVPEDRLGMGLVASMGMTGNMMLRSYKRGRGFFSERKQPRTLAERIMRELDVVTPGVEWPVGRMSGGNVQKVLVGREIASSPQVLMVAYPVRGLDINSSHTIYRLLNEQKKKRFCRHLRGRGPGCAAGPVRPHPGAGRRTCERHGGRARRHQGADRSDDDQS